MSDPSPTTEPVDGFELTNESLAAMAAEVGGTDGPGSPGWNGEQSVTRDVNAAVIAQLRENKGQLADGLAAGALLILTTTGAKSGAPRAVPLGYMEVDDRLFVIASMGGSTRNPPWYHNLRADPEVTVELDGDRFAARAVEVTGSDREGLVDQLAEVAPHFAAIQAKVDRVVPVIELTRS